jgi:K+-transporting ATPase KdpF subunit
MTTTTIVILAVTLAVMIYLVIALLRPEKF